jgi:DNA helicase HerA-like ATPase
MHEIVVGRTPEDTERFGSKGACYVGKNIVGTGEDAHLANKVLIDLLRPHIILVCGKRGSGKSYTGGIIAEEIALLPEELRKNLTVVMIDTMGIYWSMKLPNEEQVVTLNDWGLEPMGLPDRVKTYVPYLQKKEFEDAEIPVDFGISISPDDFSASDWSLAFNLPATNPASLGLQKIVDHFHKRGAKFTIDDMISRAKDSQTIDTRTKSSLVNMLTAADSWGVFGSQGIKPDEIMKPGMINVFDVSRLRASEAWSVRNLLVAMVSRTIYEQRVIARRQEEMERIGEIDLKDSERKPMVWLVIDEAHQFCGSQFDTVSTGPLLTIVKQGRQPGISFVPMTQMPEKIHPEVISQSDIVLSHRMTSKSDLSSLQSIMQTYLMEDLWKSISNLPKTRGSAIVLDDNSERIFSIQARPRLTWHGGESAVAAKE